MQFFVAEGTYVGIFIFMVLTGFGLPLPEELAIVAAGIMSANGQLATGAALAALVLGGLVGDAVVYAIGTRLGDGILARHRWLPRVNPVRFEQVRGLLERHGFKVLFVARFLVGLRFIVYLAVGASRMSFRRFMLIDAVCAALVIGSFFALSFFLSDRYGDVIYGWLRTGEFLVTAAVVGAGLVVLGVLRWRRARTDVPKLP